MSLPATINSQVDPAAVTRVTRLFNNTLGDILSELIQNARRAGASAVDLKVIDADGTAFLAIADDGAGIEEPSVILALGRSGWGDEIADRKSVVEGKSVSVRVGLGGGRIIKKKTSKMYSA